MSKRPASVSEEEQLTAKRATGSRKRDTVGLSTFIIGQLIKRGARLTSTTDLLLELKKIAADKGFLISDNQGGGNCMFHVLSEQLDLVKGIKISHQELRQTVVNYLKMNPKLWDGTELFNFVDVDRYSSWNAYLTNMAADGTWGDHVILHGASNCFQTRIHVISSLPHHHDKIIIPERDVASSNPLVLGHVHNLHYVSLIPLELSGPEYILARGEKAIEAYRRALKDGVTFDKRVKVLLIGQDRVGKTSVGRSLKGEKFKEDESSTEGVQVDVALKNVGSEPWKNSMEEQEMTTFEHKCALLVSNGLSATSPELEFQSQDPAIVPVEFEKGISEQMAHLGPIEPSKAPSANTPGIENPESKQEMLKVNLPDENPNIGKEEQKVNIPPRIFRLANENLKKNRRDGDDGIWPVITDFAGQAIYRAVHPLFFSSEAINVLMFDLTKDLHDIAQCHVRKPGHGEIPVQASDSNDTNLDHILRWMDLLHSFKHGANGNILPHVILVGTKADLVADPSEIIENVTDTICETTQVFSEHIRETFTVDNTRAGRPQDEEDPNIVSLRNTILKMGNEMPHTKKEVPLKWLQVENEVYELASKGENYITRQDFKMNICDKICQFETDDFEVLLVFLHDRGTVVYHGCASDPGCLVVLNPKWLIDILCQLITVEKQAKEPIRIRNLRKQLGRSGVLKTELLDHACKSLGITNIKESLLFIMKKFNLLCEYKGKDGNTIYLVPCMLTSKPLDNLVLNIAENEGPAPVFLTFNTKYVPGGLFSRLIVLFVEFTSRITKRDPPQLYSNFARFFIGAVTGVEFVCYKRVIKVSIWDYTNSSSDPLDKEPQICSELLSFLQNSLEKLQKDCHWMRTLTWDLSARCNLCTAELVDGTEKCFWHRQKFCLREDCAHYVSLTKKPVACERTEGPACCPPKTWSQVKFDVSGRELVIPLSDDQHDGDDDEGYTHEVVQRILAAKDEGLVSDKAYHELRMALPEKVRSHVPPLSAILQERRSQNKEIKVVQIPEAKQADGARRSVRDVLQYLIAIPEVKDTIKKDGSKIKLRFAADGRRTSKRIGTVMAVFNILCENKATYEYQYTLALYNGKEDYDELKACLGHTFQEIDDLKAEGILIDGEHFDVEWYCCSDWKFLAFVYGLNGASSKYFCIWCYCCKDQINNLDIDEWPIERRLSDCTRLCQRSTTAARKGCTMPPLLNIPFEFVVVDTLHLFLRIMGLLFHQVVEVVVNNDCPDILTKEMERIQVEFKFYEEYNKLAEKNRNKVDKSKWERIAKGFGQTQY